MRQELEEELRTELRREVAAATERARAQADTKVRQVEQELEALRQKAGDAATREAELLRQQRELEERARESDVTFEQRLRQETARIADKERAAAEERVATAVAEEARRASAELAALQDRLARAAEREGELAQKQDDLRRREQEMGDELERRVAVEAKRARDAARAEADERVARERAEDVERHERAASEAQRKLLEASQREAALLAKQRELETRERAAIVEAERRINAESARIRAEIEARANERAATEADRRRLLEEEQAQYIAQLKRDLEAMRERVHQRSGESVGEAQEVVLRDTLRDAFATDTVDDVAKGMQGGDVLHHVNASDGRACGTILWESKRTRAFSHEWLAKLRDDQRAAGAECAVIVSQALPPDVRHFELREGVWICSWACAIPLAAALRVGMLEAAVARASSEGRGEKMALLYEYLTGAEFRNRVTGMLEAFQEMQHGLESERRAMLTQWKRRERQIQRALTNITAFYGDLQGLAGKRLEDLPLLSLGELALPAAAEEGDETDGDVPEGEGADPRLVELLYELIPADGSAVGNATLAGMLEERALVTLGVEAGRSVYQRSRQVLITSGRIRKGRGRGGSVARAGMGG